MRESGATSGVDRLHTALHGHLIAVCRQAGLTVDKDAGLTQCFKTVRIAHPAFAVRGPRAEDVDSIVLSLATIVSKLDPVRNRASVAHPNDELLAAPEAMLMINAARTLLSYVAAKLRA